MHTNNAVRRKRNKHGRTGVTRATRNIPLSEAQSTDIREKAWKAGFTAGTSITLRDVISMVNVAKNIRAARKMLEEMAK